MPSSIVSPVIGQRSYFYSFSILTYAPAWYLLKKNKKRKLKELYDHTDQKGLLEAQLPTETRVNLDEVAQSLVQLSSACLHMVQWEKQRNS